MMESNKLLPCPFCGGEAGMDADKIGKGKELYYVYCKNDCITQYGYSYSKEEAIQSWNTRKPMERIVERVEEEYNKWADIYDIDKFHGALNEYAEGKSDALKYAIDIVERDGIYAE